MLTNCSRLNSLFGHRAAGRRASASRVEAYRELEQLEAKLALAWRRKNGLVGKLSIAIPSDFMSDYE
jgi:hypothetical protein